MIGDGRNRRTLTTAQRTGQLPLPPVDAIRPEMLEQEVRVQANHPRHLQARRDTTLVSRLVL